MRVKTWRTEPDVYPLRDAVVVDGDTIKATVVLPLGITKHQIIRLKDWWAPEPTGASIAQGLAAKGLLERFCEGKNLFIWVMSARYDRFGRLVASLFVAGRIVEPSTVLGCYQLTKDAHKRSSEQTRASLEERVYQAETSQKLRVAEAHPPEGSPPVCPDCGDVEPFGAPCPCGFRVGECRP